MQGLDVVVPYSKDLVQDAPSDDPDRQLSPEEEHRLYAHHGLTSGDAQPRTSGTTAQGAAQGTAGRSTDDAMTPSEQRLTVRTDRTEADQARLRKIVMGETDPVNVPVSKEQVILEREPITEATAPEAMDGPAIAKEEYEVVLTEERPVVATEAVPVERVGVGKEQVAKDGQVTEEGRKGQIDAEGRF